MLQNLIKKGAWALPLAFTMPLLVFAQAETPLERLVLRINQILNAVVPVVMVLALIYFFWGLAKYILSAGDEEKKKAGRDIMVWGVIALFVMAAVWGLVAILAGTFLTAGPGAVPTGTSVTPIR